jgi:rod shape determining protein RodA
MPLVEPRSLQTLARFEWPTVVISLVLAGIGLGLIFSATAPMGAAGRSLVLKQITWCSLGVVLMAMLLMIDYRYFERWATWFYILIIVALVFAWAMGKVTAGSRRWLDLGFMRFQPSEFAKLAVVLVLAKYFDTRTRTVGSSVWDVLTPLILTAIPVGLVLIQPDLGTAAVVVLIAVSMVLFAGVSRRVLIWSVGVLACLVPILLLTGDRFLMEYQKKRLLTFVNPDYDPLGAGYHIMQSQIAIGSGGAFGKGYLKGTQNQLMFLPVKHTDFVFSVLAEEWGFLGCSLVLMLFAALFLRGLAITANARDNFGAMTAFGCTALIFWHVVINVGMTIGLLPVVGVPLTFLSYGGSSLLAGVLAISLIANIGMRRFSY